MDIQTYALLKGLKREVENITPGYSYKGSVIDVSSLPSSDNTTGDLYTVGSEQYVWDGSVWVKLGTAITNAQIDSLF